MATIELTFPQNGMNSTLDGQVLSSNYGAYIENFTLHNGANGRLRYGTRVLSPLLNNEIDITSLTQNGTTVTAITAQPHGLNALSRVTILGAYPLGYNVFNKAILYVDATTFQYQVKAGLGDSSGHPILRKQASGTYQNLTDSQKIVAYFDFKDAPIVAVQDSELYVPQNIALLESGQEIQITNPVLKFIPFMNEHAQVVVHYTLGGRSFTVKTAVTASDLTGDVLTLKIQDTLNPAATVTGLDVFFVQFYAFHEATGRYTVLSDQRFFAFSCFRSTIFEKNLIIVNGVDQPHVWNGTTFEELKSFKTLTTQDIDELTVVNRNQFEGVPRLGVDPYESEEINVSFEYRHFPITSITQDNGTSLVTCPLEHALETGDEIFIFQTGVETYDEQQFQITKVSNTTFTLNGTNNLGEALGGSFNLEIATRKTVITNRSGRLQITLSDPIFPETSQAFPLSLIRILQTQCIKSLPAFRFIRGIHQRLFALGPGIEKANTALGEGDRMVVYYAAQVGSLTGWIDPNLGRIPFLDLSQQQHTDDQLNAIQQLSDGLVFLGRLKTQIWQGRTPGDFVFLKSIPVGCLHGNLTQGQGNDVLFMSAYGLLNLSSLKLIDEFAVGDDFGKEITATLEKQIKALTSDPFGHLRVQSFVYPHGRFVGFRLRDVPFLYEVDSYAQGWMVFTGDFQKANVLTFSPHTGRLILAQKNKLYAYGDGINAPFSFGDLDGTRPIVFKWITPLLDFENRLWSNQRVKVEANTTQNVSIRLGISQNQNPLEDVSLSLLLKKNVTRFDESFFEENIWSQAQQKPNVKKCKFATSLLSASVSGQGFSTLQLDLKKIIFFGKGGH